jgi:fluoride exporter
MHRERRGAMMSTLLWIAAFGAAGAVSRYTISGVVQRWCGGDAFPAGTLLVNVAGCFLIGVLAGSHTHMLSDSLRHGLSAGFLGALTTFSTFGLETVHHLERQHYLIAIGSVAANLLVGCLAAWGGLKLGGFAAG